MSQGRRRQFLLTAGALLAAPVAAGAQQPRMVYRVGLIFTTSPVSEMAGAEPNHPSVRAFVHELRALGLQEGKNLLLERRTAEGMLERLPDIMAELVRLKADVIVAVGHPKVIPAVKAAPKTPIVLVPSYFDPVEAGLVVTLARPGRNVTGLSIAPSPQIEAKRLELLKSALPNLARVAFLGMKTDWEDAFGKSIQGAARRLGVALFQSFHTPNDYTDAFAVIIRNRPDAVLVANTPVNFGNRSLIVAFTTNNRLPGMYSRREYVEAGGLLSYGVDITDLFRRAAQFVHKIINGAKPADLPVEQPTQFELVVNMKTAKDLGLTIPPSILLRADRVIE